MQELTSIEKLIKQIHELKNIEPTKRRCAVVKQATYESMIKSLENVHDNSPKKPINYGQIYETISGIPLYIDDEYFKEFYNSDDIVFVVTEESFYLQYLKFKRSI